MRRVAIVAVAVVLLASCRADTVETEIDPTKVTYARDVRTSICFATVGRRSMDTGGKMSWSFSVTAVQCSPEVLNLVPISQGGKHT